MKYNGLTIFIVIAFVAVILYIYTSKLPIEQFERFSMYYSPIWNAANNCYQDDSGNLICDTNDYYSGWPYWNVGNWSGNSGYYAPWWNRFRTPFNRGGYNRGGRGNFRGGAGMNRAGGMRGGGGARMGGRSGGGGGGGRR